MTVRVTLLGRPSVVSDDGTPLPLPRGHKTWLALTRIALTRGGVTRAQLAEELFDDAADPMAALRWVLADVRRVLGMPGILQGDPVRLADADVWIDAQAMESDRASDDDLGGQLLETVATRGAPGIEMWLSMARAHLAGIALQQLRRRALENLADGAVEHALALARRAVELEPLDEQVQELLLRSLVASGLTNAAAEHLAVCEKTFAREGIPVSPALRAAAVDPRTAWSDGPRAAVVARSLLRAGTAALDAGAPDAGVETLRRAVAEAEAATDPALTAETLEALGSALVHSVRGFDGEGALVLHRAVVAARSVGLAAVEADALRELAFVDVQAGRHSVAASALDRALDLAPSDEPRLHAGILAVAGMNAADVGHHRKAIELLSHSADLATDAGALRQQAWSVGVLARSFLLSGDRIAAEEAACRSIEIASAQRWNSFLPWPMSIHAECLTLDSRWDEAQREAEEAFALGCQIGDPCWEAMAARMLALVAQHDGDYERALRWIAEARTRNDRVTDRYVWISCFLRLTQLQIESSGQPERVARHAAQLYDEAVRHGLNGFAAWALVYRGDPGSVTLANEIGVDVEEPALRALLADRDATLAL